MNISKKYINSSVVTYLDTIQFLFERSVEIGKKRNTSDRFIKYGAQFFPSEALSSLNFFYGFLTFVNPIKINF